jgi:hypothetical protein
MRCGASLPQRFCAVGASSGSEFAALNKPQIEVQRGERQNIDFDIE